MDDNSSMLDVYIYEENQLLDQLEEILLETEKTGAFSSEHINEIFRIMHTIKGSSAMMEFNAVSTLAHAVEDLFYYIRENKPTELDVSAVCDHVLAASDFIKAEVEKLEGGGKADGDASGIEADIKAFLAHVSGKTAAEASRRPGRPSAVPAGPEAAPVVSAAPAAQAAGQKYTVHLVFEEGGQMENLRAYNIMQNLSEYTTQLFSTPADLLSTPADLVLSQGFDLFFSTEQPEERIRSLFNESLYLKSYELMTVDSFDETAASEAAAASEEPSAASAALAVPVEEAPPAQPPGAGLAAPAQQQSGSPKNGGAKLNLISVNVGKLDTLMNLVGELVISESMVTKNPDLSGLELQNFHKAARQLRKLTDELQDIVMSIRMVPIGGTFRKMQRIVRDMSRKLNKDVEFVTEGEDTEVDKNIIDHLSDPLMHLIRNSMDHGVEPEAVREAAGKPRRARVTLSAQDAGGDVKISVSDDGAGLDREKILKKAAANGLLTKPARDMSDREVFSLILLPGFSTNDKVTEYSGRGVGMDVVKQNIEEVGGSISIHSVRGKGTTMTIVIPLTLAIADAMELSVGNCIFTLPIGSIEESFRPRAEQILHDNEDNEMILIRGNVYPIIRLHRLFNIPTEVTDLDKGILVLAEGENKSACLFVDALIGEQ